MILSPTLQFWTCPNTSDCGTALPRAAPCVCRGAREHSRVVRDLASPEKCGDLREKSVENNGPDQAASYGDQKKNCKHAFLVLRRLRPTGETPWNGVLYSSKRFHDSFAFPVKLTFTSKNGKKLSNLEKKRNLLWT